MAAEVPYRILDEPVPSGLGAWVVNPLWPFLATMLAGQWLGLPWFVFNGRALGSATRRKELWLALAWFPVGAALVVGILLLRVEHVLSATSVRYVFLLVPTCKAGLGYWLFELQHRGFALHEHFNGRVRNGATLLIVGTVISFNVGANWLGGSALLNILWLVVR